MIARQGGCEGRGRGGLLTVQPLLFQRPLSLALHESHVSDSPPPSTNQESKIPNPSDESKRIFGARGRIVKNFF